jgi:hypothetical protein
MKSTKPPHIILGLAYNSNINEIKKKYKKLAREFHPDKYKGNKKYANDQFSLIDSAYKTMISDEYQDYTKNVKQNGIFYYPTPNSKKNNIFYGSHIKPNIRPNIKPSPRVLCNGTVLMTGGMHPAHLSYEMLQNMRRNI